MLEQIRLKNFQPWEDLLIALDPLVTTIIGPNGKGKTAVLRALYWLCFGRPLGNDFIRDGAAYCQITLQLDKQRIDRRRTTTGGAIYRLDKATQYKAVGTTVPVEISKLLNVSPINFQQQLDPPFWMLESPAQVARNLNAIVNLDLIDKAMAECGSRVRTTRTTISVLQDRVLRSEQSVKSIDWVTDFALELADLEEREQRFREVEEERISLSLCMSKVHWHLKQKTQHEEIVNAGDLVTIRYETMQRVRQEADDLTGLLGTIRLLQAAVEDDIPDLAELRQDNRTVIQAEASYDVAKRDRRELSQAIETIKRLSNTIEESDEQLLVEEQELQERTGGRCPVCRKPL